MSKSTGLSTRLYVNGYDLSGDVSAINSIADSQALQDVTGLDDAAIGRLALAADGAVSINGWFNASALQEHAGLLVSGKVPTGDRGVLIPLEITLGDLMSRFPNVSYKMMLECGGNGRAFFTPEARGNPWTNGGAGCAEWTGVRLADVLKAAGVKSSAVYTGQYGADPHLSGDATKPSISRGVPIAKAMEPHTLIAFKMNGKDLPLIHGGPVRLIVPGWTGSTSTKWLTRIWVRDKEHDGPGMGGFSYRMAKTPIVPGSKGDEKDTVILEAMPVRSVITFPADGAKLAAGTRKLDLRGHAWAGESDIKTVDISTDYGVSWKPAKVDPPPNKYAWQRFTASVDLPAAGYYEVWAKATDSKGVTQPFVAGNWNPQGYGGNPINHIRVLVES